MKKLHWHSVLLSVALCLFVLGGALSEELYTIDNGVLTVREGVTELGNAMGLYLDASKSDIVRQIVLPDSLRALHASAISDFQNVDTLVIPEGVETMTSPFFACGFRRIELPATLRGISGFKSDYSTDLYNLEQLAVAPDNTVFRSVDGVLFTADMQTLLFYPSNRPGAYYAVPQGVTTIASGAFSANRNLERLSLPMGLIAIEGRAFTDCERLTDIYLPLSLERIDECAFAHDVALRNVTVPAHTRLTENAFLNCTLSGRGVSLPPEDAFEFLSTPKELLPDLHAVLNPEYASDLVPIYAEPNDRSTVLAKCQSGSYVRVTGQQGAYTAVAFSTVEKSEIGQNGFVRTDALMMMEPYQGMFTVTDATVRRQGAWSYSGDYALPVGPSVGIQLPDDTRLSVTGWHGQWVEYCDSDPRSPAQEYSYGRRYLSPLDLTFHRAYTGDERTFGLVISTDMNSRVNLREQPKKNAHHIGKYYSGTQVEVLGESGDWYHVRVGFDIGYMMKEFVQIVPQEDAP